MPESAPSQSSHSDRTPKPASPDPSLVEASAGVTPAAAFVGIARDGSTPRNLSLANALMLQRTIGNQAFNGLMHTAGSAATTIGATRRPAPIAPAIAIQRVINEDAFKNSKDDFTGRADAINTAYTWYLSIYRDLREAKATPEDLADVSRRIDLWIGNNRIATRLTKGRLEPFASGLVEMQQNLEGLKGSVGTQRAQVTAITDLASIDRLTLDAVAAIDPQSIVPYKILHDIFQQNWEYTKHELATPPTAMGVNTPVRQALMRKLLDYRTWHTNEIIKLASEDMAQVYSDPVALNAAKSGSKGSTTLTSDVDVNLKGNRTEDAVAVFNDLFRANASLPSQTWDFEAGIVYDVNVYSMDWMYKFAGTPDPARTVDQATPTAPPSGASAATAATGEVKGESKEPLLGYERATASVVTEEGARKGRTTGGIEGAPQRAADDASQEAFSLVKTRLYMTPAEWAAFKEARLARQAGAAPRASSAAAPPDPALTRLTAVFAKAEAEFAKYREAVIGEMRSQVRRQVGALMPAVPDETAGSAEIQGQAAALSAASGTESDNAHRREAQRANLLMASSNRLYEAKVQALAAERATLKTMIDQFNAGFDGMGASVRAAANTAIDVQLVKIRGLVAEANLYANEASVTQGTVQHVVVGLQGNNRLNLTRNDLMNAVNEHMGDALKEINRHHDSLADAVYKAAKYLWRMTDAAKNAGYGALSGVTQLYDVCYYIAEHVKGADETAAETALAIFQAQYTAKIPVAASGPPAESKGFQSIEEWLAGQKTEDVGQVNTVADLRRITIGIGTAIANAPTFDRATTGASLTQANPGRTGPGTGRGDYNINM